MEATAGAEEGAPDGPRLPEQQAPQSPVLSELDLQEVDGGSPMGQLVFPVQPHICETEPESAGAPDFGAGLPDEVLRRVLLACAAEGEAGLALARCAAVHPAWWQVARRTPGCVLAAFGVWRPPTPLEAAERRLALAKVAHPRLGVTALGSCLPLEVVGIMGALAKDVLGTRSGRIVEWVVPERVHSVGLEVCGAQGGGSYGNGRKKGGRGARVVCRETVRPGERLAVLVGQAGGTGYSCGGGGGGSFVVRSADGSPLAVAGGGGGAGHYGEGGGDAVLGETGGHGGDAVGWEGEDASGSAGGSKGGGGLGDGFYVVAQEEGRHAGGSGGGLVGDGVALRPGEDPNTECGVGRAFAHGGAGGTRGTLRDGVDGPGNIEGGFGGGGCGSSYVGGGVHLVAQGGGGGGYSGGGGGSDGQGGGGGACWMGGGEGRVELRTQGGDGRVTITLF